MQTPGSGYTVNLTVLDVDGHPAALRNVYLRGWSAHWGYRNWGPLHDNKYGKADGWRYTTDSQGEVSVLIGNFTTTTSEEAPPGLGTYAFLVDAGTNDAGGVSPRFYAGAPPDPRADWAPEWGQPIGVPPKGLDLTLQIQKGVTVQGRVVDDRYLHRPLAGIEVSAETDLAIGTRSGIGDAIFGSSAITDQYGRFVIPHRFPNLLWIGVSPALWMKTSVNGTWVKADNLVKPSSPTGIVDLQIAALSHPAFTYTGRVTDAEGIPVARTEVTVAFTREPMHSHLHYGMQLGTTDAQGRYSVTVPSPWVNVIYAFPPDEPARTAEKLASPFLDPGEYDLQLPPSAKKNDASPSASR